MESQISFESFGLKSPVLKALKEMSFENPTEVQKKVIPVALEKKDLIVLSKTGSGKTASFGIPIVNTVTGQVSSKPKALILTPTRELALQVCDDVEKIASYSDIKTTCVYGQHSMNKEVEKLDKGVDIIFGTPGRTLDHLRSGTMDLSDLEYFVLDEADRMLNMGFIEQVESIIKFLPEKRQTMLLSATIPFEIMNISWQYMNNPVEIKLESETKTVERVKQVYYKVEHNRKRSGLYKVISLYRPESLIIFCNTRWQVDRLKNFLEEKGFSVKGIHGGVSQKGRTSTMDSFKKGAHDILVATDVAARGIHVDELEMVINYDVPVEKDNYVHRIGRTGRIGNSGIAVTLACSEDMYSLYEIEEHIGSMISEVYFPSDEKLKESFKHAKEFYNLKEKTTKNEEYKHKKRHHNEKKSYKINKQKIKKQKHSKKSYKPNKNKKNNKGLSDNNNVVFVFNNEKKENLGTKIKPEKNKTKVSIKNNLEEKKKSFFKRIFGRK